MGATNFRELLVWQKAHKWVLGIYRATKCFPAEERACLTSQLRRAAVSVPANIVEGFKKKGKPDKVRYLNIAQASLEEARYFMLLAQDLGYGDTSALEAVADEVARMLNAYIAKIQSGAKKQTGAAEPV